MSFITWPSERSAWPSRSRSSFSVLPAQWHCQPGFTANVSLTLKYGAPPFCSLVRSWLCAQSQPPQPRQPKICSDVFDAGYWMLNSDMEYYGSNPSTATMNLKGYLRSRQKEIDRALDHYLPKPNTKPTTLHRAMRYSL